MPSLSTRRARAFLPAAALLLAIAPTGALAQSPSAAPADPGAPASAAAPAEAATGFPLEIAHKYGTTVIESAPERIVSVGLLEQDALLALGIVPAGVTEWFGGYPSAAWPWAQPYLGDAESVVVGDATTLDFELIKAQDPDLIVGLYSGLTQEQYDTLSGIAPTVAQPAEYTDYGIPWQELTRTVGQIVGKAEGAEALVTGVEDQFAQVQAEHPEFVGASAIVATPWEGIFVYGPEDVRGRLLTSLGFVLPEGVEEATGASWGGNLSEEAADLLDVDAIIWLDAANVEGYGGPLYPTLDVHTQGREVHVDSFGDPLGGATSFVTVLSLPYLLDGLVPMLAAAVDGDPATAVPTSPTAAE